MISVRLRIGEVVIVIATDAELHPDLLDELTTRALKLFTDFQAGLPEEDGA